jgi:hypothetical protein
MRFSFTGTGSLAGIVDFTGSGFVCANGYVAFTSSYLAGAFFIQV